MEHTRGSPASSIGVWHPIVSTGATILLRIFSISWYTARQFAGSGWGLSSSIWIAFRLFLGERALAVGVLRFFGRGFDSSVLLVSSRFSPAGRRERYAHS
jgi:hypothetical protein